jgi:hypothetical protein
MAVVLMNAAASEEGAKVKILDGLQYPRRLTIFLACLEGAAQYLKIDVSPGWLYGGTGHAFVMCLGEDLCPSGSHCWRQEPLHRLCEGLPLRFRGVASPRATPEVVEKAWTHVRKSIDLGRPCFGWHYEWILIKGYDAEGYLYADGVAGPRDWRDFGARAIGFLEMYSVEPGQPSADTKAIREALAFAVAWAENPSKWTMKGYYGGAAAYDAWIRGMTSGKANAFGLAYHAKIWSECRGFAVEFLKEADIRTKGRYAGLLKEAVDRYAVVSASLSEVSRLWPFPDEGDSKAKEKVLKARTLDRETRDRIVAELEKAKEAEAAGVDAIRKIVPALANAQPVDPGEKK